MELVVHIQDQESLAVACEQGAGAVAVSLPRDPDARVWSELTNWQDAARLRGLRFYLVWDGLLTERELPTVADKLERVARLNPDGVQLRDLGLVKEARRLYPHLPLVAAGNWGAHNSPAVRLAETLGFGRVVVDGPVSLKDLALMRRQTAMPLAVTLLTGCLGYASLCLMAEYLGVSCAACCLARIENAGTLMAALETFSGLCQLGIEAVQIRGGLFAPASLAQVIGLFRSVAGASPMERPGVLAAARQVVEAFGENLQISSPPPETGNSPPVYPLPLSQRSAASSSRPQLLARNRIWLEARDYTEAAELSREWREPLVLTLTSDNYAAFLPEHRHWGPRRLIWRLPPAIPESSLAFYQKALETLGQGDYNRFVAGDWGAVALAGAAGGQVYGTQTLGVRNSWSAKTLREFKVVRVCLPPGHRSGHWRDILAAAPSGRFWSYLYHCATLAVCPAEAAALTPPENLHWITEDGKALLCLKASQNLLDLEVWFKAQAIFPLMVALPHSPRPRGQIPPWLTSRPQDRPRR
jgi:collagenase-like PrtC family protease